MNLVGDDDIVIYDPCQTLYIQQLARQELGRIIGDLGGGHEYRTNRHRAPVVVNRLSVKR